MILGHYDTHVKLPTSHGFLKCNILKCNNYVIGVMTFSK